MYLSRVAAIRAGLPVETPAITLNRLCGSGLQAILTAAQAIQRGDAKTAVAGGAESMSRAPYWLPAMRWGACLNDASVVDTLVGAVTDPFDGDTCASRPKTWHANGRSLARTRRMLVECGQYCSAQSAPSR
jgi:acetyl-CoA acetyltransferase